MRASQPNLVILDKATVTGAGKAQLATDFRHILLSVVGSNTASFTIKFAGSMQNEMPDFNTSPSYTNQWDYVQVKDLINQNTIDGSTGLTFSANGVKNIEVNTNGLRWVTAIVTSMTSGEASVFATLINDSNC